MINRVVLLVVVVAGIATGRSHGLTETSDVIDVGTAKQLFIDGSMLGSSRGVHVRMNRPYRAPELLVPADQPWETSANGYVWNQNTVRKENGKIRLWYQLITLRQDANLVGPHAATQSMAYAESSDGIHFTKPALRLHEFGGTKDNSILLPVSRGGTVWIDPKAPPEQRYRSQTKDPKGKLTFFHSADGIRWAKTHTVSIGDCDTQNIAFWDDRLGRYVLYARRWIRFPDKDGNYRIHRRLDAKDLVHWENEVTVLKADDADLGTYPTPTKQPPIDYYGACVFRYPDEQGVYVMLTQPFWHWFERSGMHRLGPNTMDVRLCVGRDGKRVRPVGGRSAFLRLGPEGSFCSRMIWAVPNPIRMGDELWFYFWGSNMDHSGHIDPAGGGAHRTGIGRAILRLDGFVSVDADHAGGEIVTPLMRFNGNALELNVDAGGGGCARVEILDDKDQPVAGFGKDRCAPICVNAVSAPVTWGEDSRVSNLAGKPIKLRFHLRDCKLYAFQFRNVNR